MVSAKTRTSARGPIVVVVFCAAALAFGGCFLLHDDYPNDTCESDMDCFRAQGEVCNLTTHECEIRADAGPVIDADTTDADTTDAAPLPDADLTPDATPDAMP